MSSSERKAQFLGMPHGTAQNRLRKLVLFNILCRHEENVCFKCSELIVAVDDLSMEHKQPWEGRSVALFWDVENVAFSHLACNRPHKFSAGPAPILVPDGTAWCSNCQKPQPLSEFYKDSTRRLGVSSNCIESKKSKRN